MEDLASKLSDSSELAPSSEGNEVQKLLGGIADRAKEEKFLYTKFFAIGLFRLLELTGWLCCCAASVLRQPTFMPTEEKRQGMLHLYNHISSLAASSYAAISYLVHQSCLGVQ